MRMDTGQRVRGLAGLRAKERETCCAACAAHAKVQVADQSGSTIAGNGLGDCDVLTGDSVRHMVMWKGDSTVRTPQASYARRTPYWALRSVMRDAELCSFRLESRNEGATPPSSVCGVAVDVDEVSVTVGPPGVTLVLAVSRNGCSGPRLGDCSVVTPL